MKIIIIAGLIGCCLAAPERKSRSYSVSEGGVSGTVSKDSGVVVERAHHDAIGHVPINYDDVAIAPVMVKERRNVEEIPLFPEFGVKVVQNEKVKTVQSRGRAIDGPNHSFNYVQIPHYPEPAVKSLVPPYQQKPFYHKNRDNQQFYQQPSYQQQNYQDQSYQQSNKFYYPQQQRNDDVPQPAGPVKPIAPIPGPNEFDNSQQNVKPIAILAMNQDVNYDGTFVYDFESENGIRSAVSGSTKRLEGIENPVQVMSGSYSYTSPEGQPVETRWYADETGFHAEGSHLPVAPPVPDAIQRAVDYLKTLPPKQDEIAAQPLPVASDAVLSPQRFESFPPQQRYEKVPVYQQNYDKAPVYQQQNYDKAPVYQQQNYDKPLYQNQQQYGTYPSQKYN